MANTKSAIKKIRVDERRAKVNNRRKENFKEVRKEIRKAVESADSTKANELLPKAYKSIDKAAKNNAIHKNAAARYKAAIAKLVNSLK